MTGGADIVQDDGGDIDIRAVPGESLDQRCDGMAHATAIDSENHRQAQARGEDTDAPLSAEQRRNPHTAKARKGMYGGGAKSDRDAKLMTEHQNLASEMFGHILDRPMNDGGAE